MYVSVLLQLMFECRELRRVFCVPVGDLQPPEYPKPRVFRVTLPSIQIPISPNRVALSRRALSRTLRPSDSRSAPLSRPSPMPVIDLPRSPDEPVPGSPDEARAALAAGAPSRLIPKEETSLDSTP